MSSMNYSECWINANLSELFDVFHPIGTLYETLNADFNPNTASGWYGTWERIKDRFVYACGDNQTIGSTGGSNTHTLTISEMPSHAHGLGAHTHSIPALTMNTAGDHGHYVSRVTTSEDPAASTGYASPNYSIASNSATNLGYILKNSTAQTNWTGYSSTTGNHTHTTNASTTGGNSGNTTSVGSGTVFDIRPAFIRAYIWKRTD